MKFAITLDESINFFSTFKLRDRETAGRSIVLNSFMN